MQSGPQRRNTAGLRRDLELLEALATPEAGRAGGLGVNRLAQLTGRDKAQVSRSMATLDEAGMVERDPETKLYRLGERLFSLAARTTESRLAMLAAPHLRHLVDATHETAHLCALRNGQVLTLASELSEHSFRGHSWEGVSTSAWRTSAGRALMSHWDEAELCSWYEQHATEAPVLSSPEGRSLEGRPQLPPAPPLEKRRVWDLTSFLEEVRRIREVGYATVDEEFEAGVSGVSAPVLDFRSRVVAAINISAPQNRIGHRLQEMGELTASTARAMSRALGAPAGSPE